MGGWVVGLGVRSVGWYFCFIYFQVLFLKLRLKSLLHRLQKKLLCERVGKEATILTDSLRDFLAETTNDQATPAILDGWVRGEDEW